ncbi:ADK2 [Candida oxycetoniae]|uniref:GTP:AMP phosphotransferase, mitochondrial n=1 Tax=Candida oxycetoniae TaxID=497107 RepID=A0AAI9WY15_9ASCO|nr:ADK2 [Candida oxycetoniae]KAI3404798.1 ADK2 [Candida oxycetoniae]
MLKPTRLLLLGAPGSGKGTISRKLLNRFPQLKSISSGDVLRSHILRGTKIGVEAEKCLKTGTLVPDSTMVSLISEQLRDLDGLSSKANWLLDGFPRTFSQAQKLTEILDKNQCNLNVVVELNVDQNIILHRIESRYVHLPSGRIYSLDYNPPKVPFKDDITGEDLVKREDDNAAVFKKRLDKYNEEIVPLREYYQKLGIWHEVAGITSDIIYPKVEKLLLT